MSTSPSRLPKAEADTSSQGAGDDGAAAADGKLSELAASNLAEFFGPDGPLASHLSGYELRPTQVEMAEAVKRALLNQSIALIEAPTGTGKSIAYLAPALLSGKTVVVATANKSLQSQLYVKDIPFLSQVSGKPIDAVVVKGRSNFICTLKWEKEQMEQQRISLYDREDEQVGFLRKWLDETMTGDVDDLPFMLNSDLRPRVVSFADDCLHMDCRFYHDHCWVNHMRDRAAEAQVLITNHHLLLNALELGSAGERILPPVAVYIVDEAHQLEQTATAVYETMVTDYTVEQLLTRSVYKDNVDEDVLDELRFHNTLAFQEVANLSRDNTFRIETDLEELKKLSTALTRIAERMKRDSPFGGEAEKEAALRLREDGEPTEEKSEARKIYELGIEALNSTASKLLDVANSKRDDAYVRYAVRVFDRRRVSLEVHAAPINPASQLASDLFQPEDEDGAVMRTVVCTSATLSANGHFEHFKQRCGIMIAGEERVLPGVFDYPRQALLYQPALPAYDWKNADAYYIAVAREVERLLEVSRGRTLCLFTSWSGLQHVSALLQSAESHAIWPLRAQGDAPRDALLNWFRQTSYSVLLATRSFWEGVDIPGDDLSLVVLDKMPFPTPNDPLHSARMRAIEESGHNSFSDYMTPLMTLALKQGFGRLIRRTSDRGVVAILDERLSSKSYGRQARQDLPPARFSREFRDVHKFFRDALQSQADFAVNVWASVEGEELGASSPIRWRWRLVRFQDGKADDDQGIVTDLADAPSGQIHAALLALGNLRRRIEKAGRKPEQFGVEVRCHASAATVLLGGEPAGPLVQQWQDERARWLAVQILAVTAI